MQKKIALHLLFVFLSVSLFAGAALSSEGVTLSKETYVILSVVSAPGVLKQCSRHAPKDADSYWQPTRDEIDTLERKLPEFLTGRKDDASRPPAIAYQRQYAGFMRKGERYIYGNFYPAKMQSDNVNKVVDVCDGGARFWGIVYNVSSQKFEDIQFNGAI